MSEGEGTEGVVGDPEYGTMIFNESHLSDDEVRGALMEQHPELAAIARWSNDVQGGAGRRKHGSIFDRDRYVTPRRFIDQIDVARDAVAHDDVVSGVIESTESLAFTRIQIES